jgi:hypothetical protein
VVQHWRSFRSRNQPHSTLVTKTGSTRNTGRGGGRSARIAALAAEVHRVLPSAASVVLVRRAGARGWSVLRVVATDGRRFDSPEACRGVERAIAHRLGLLAPWLPDVKRVTLDLGESDFPGIGRENRKAHLNTVGTRTPSYRVLSTSKRRGVETRRYPDGMVREIDSRTGGPVKGARS